MSRYSEKLLYAKALMCYDVSSHPLVFDEFASDVNRIVCFAKMIKQQKLKGEEYNIRLLLNWLITSFNVFGLDAINLIFSVSDELIFEEINSFLKVLNKYPISAVAMTIESIVIHLDDYEPNEQLMADIKKEINL